MNHISKYQNDFIHYCKVRRKMSPHTVRGYGFDLGHFVRFLGKLDPPITDYSLVTRHLLEEYLDILSQEFAVKTIKRKLACVRSFFNYLEYEEVISDHPFQKFHLNMKEGTKLPNTMSITEVGLILKAAYEQNTRGPGDEFIRLRDVAILELLFAGGLRVSELCDLIFESIGEDGHSLKIHGKGNRERIIYLENKEVVNALNEYLVQRRMKKVDLPHIFISKFGEPMSTQAVRYMVTKYTKLAGISKNITPHVFRHSFASLLLEEGVDIKFIQDFMGHSSISTTQIYLHTSNEKRREILAKMHPRQKLQAMEREDAESGVDEEDGLD